MAAIKRNKLHLLGLSLALLSCQAPQAQLQTGPQPVNQLPPAATGPITAPQTPAAAKQSVSFRLDPGFAFKTQNAEAAFVKLVVKKGSETYYADEANANGFVAVSGSTTLTAHVPPGDNWVVTAGFYYTENSVPFLELKTAFDVTEGNNIVNLSAATYLTGAIVEELHRINSPKLASLNLADLQAYVAGLTIEEDDYTANPVVLSRLSTFNPPNQTALSARQLAYEIHNGYPDSFPLSLFAGSLATPATYRQTPSLVGTFKAQSGNAILMPPAINSQGKLFGLQAQGVSTYRLHGVQPNPLTLDPLTFFSILHGTAANPGLSFNRLFNPFLSLGLANNTGENSIEVAYLFESDADGHPSFKAIRTSDGSLVWSYDFGDPEVMVNLNLGAQVFAPTFKREKGDEVEHPNCDCDDWDVVYASLAAQTTAKTGLYAFEQSRPGGAGTAGGSTGSQKWFYPAPGGLPIQGGASLSHDGTRLYTYIQKEVPSIGLRYHLVTLDTSNGQEVGTPVPLRLNSFPLLYPPVVGSNGAVYVFAHEPRASLGASGRVNNSGLLYSFDKQGVLNWERAIAGGSIYAPLVDTRSNQDVIYLVSTSSEKYIRIFSYDQSGSQRWGGYFEAIPTLPSGVTLKAFEMPGPVLGQEPDGGRVLYLSAKLARNGMPFSNKIYAVKDAGDSAAIDWTANAGGMLAAADVFDGMTLHQNHLYYGTADGGDGQFISLQAMKVSAPEMPAQAPWPKTGGNLHNRNVPHYMPSALP